MGSVISSQERIYLGTLNGARKRIIKKTCLKRQTAREKKSWNEGWRSRGDDWEKESHVFDYALREKVFFTSEIPNEGASSCYHGGPVIGGKITRWRRRFFEFFVKCRGAREVPMISSKTFHRGYRALVDLCPRVEENFWMRRLFDVGGESIRTRKTPRLGGGRGGKNPFK